MARACSLTSSGTPRVPSALLNGKTTANPTFTFKVFCYSFFTTILLRVDLVCPPALFTVPALFFTVLLTTSKNPLVRKQQSVNVLQVVPLVLAGALLTVGLALFLSNASEFADVVQSVIVVFGGAFAGLLLSFSTAQILQALQLALTRGIYGGYSPREMIRAMLKVCELSRRDGLLGVAEVRSNSIDVEEACQLIGEASDDSSIRFALERRVASERVLHQTISDVFVFASLYALLFGVLGSLLRFTSSPANEVSSGVLLPFICGASLGVILVILIARLRTAHMRELVVADIAYRGAAIILDDNNVQRLNARLALLVPVSLRG